MEIVFGILMAVIGIFAGGFITHIYSRRSTSELSGVENSLAEKLDDMKKEFQAVSMSLVREKPEISKRIDHILQKYTGVEPYVMSERDLCPKCSKATLNFSRWGNGPLGVSNAWYACNNCKYQFQTSESSCD